MPLTYFLSLTLFVILAAGGTLALAFWLNIPMAALAFAALTASLCLGLRQWR